MLIYESKNEEYISYTYYLKRYYNKLNRYDTYELCTRAHVNVLFLNILNRYLYIKKLYIYIYIIYTYIHICVLCASKRKNYSPKLENSIDKSEIKTVVPCYRHNDIYIIRHNVIRLFCYHYFFI